VCEKVGAAAAAAAAADNPDHTITTPELSDIQFIASYDMFWSIIDSYATRRTNIN